MCSTDRVIVGAAAKGELGRVADVVEMESGDVLFEANAFGARVIAVRGISDTWDEDLPIDFNRVLTGEGNVIKWEPTERGKWGSAKPLARSMRAAVYRGKDNVVVEDVPVPEIGDGEVLIRVAACGICGTDIKKIHHGFVKPPQILGHEVAGTVVAVGRGVTKWKVGDRVVSFHHIPCGNCFYCEQKLFSQCATYKKVG